MRTYPSCPNCTRAAQSGAPSWSLYKCANCGTKYCTQCGGEECPQCGDAKRTLIGKIGA